MATILALSILLLLAGTVWLAAARCPLLRLLIRSFDGWADLAREQRQQRL
jgi:hypothetical protein